ncbi:replicative DNA helicase [Stutzerimonas stutzeri]|uniref:replicative DNA helicase n=1 Tax=Stutzerimonas stutzeri TaxID=316 RepID=UPI00265A160A|nr:DnaB-like helicase C-terminal domain-containing protein [Stutzerimonas stutzeri]MCF6780895.1 AAA family ATPase [Stutzerimonas stutzeri]MCF6803465.1 AAA family ATPase [Stutzerimonas stutzeri]
MSRELFSIEAEHAVLGSIMLDPNLFDAITGKISAADFYDVENAALYQTILDCQAAGEPIDPVTVGVFRSHLPSGDSTIAYAAEIAQNTPSTANWETYTRVVRERAVLRRLVETAATVSDMASEDKPLAQIIAGAQQAMADLRDLEDGEPDYKRIDEIVHKNVDTVDAKHNGQRVIGLSTGLPDLDKLTRHLRPRTVTVVAGLPGSGKTTLGLQIVQNVAMTGAGVGLVFSLEMPEEELGQRVIASLGSVDIGRLDSGVDMQDSDWAGMTAAVAKCIDKPLYVCDRPGMTPARIRSVARQVQRNHGLDIVMVDYLGLIPADARGRSRTEEVGKISKAMVNLAKELGIPVILLSQLNRDSTKRVGKKPVSADLRDSGEIEADAHCILMVHRDMDTEEGQNGVTEIIMTKCRHAPVGSCLLQQQGQFARFVSFAGAREVSQEEVEMGRFRSRSAMGDFA